MDNIDLQILKILKENARVRASAIASEINLSVSAVTERMKRLETTGVIEQYTVIINENVIGNDVSAIIEVALEHPRCIDSFIELANSIPNIISCHCVTGDYDFVLKVVIDSSEGLGQIYSMIKSFDGVKDTRTYIILKTVKNDLSLLPDNV